MTTIATLLPYLRQLKRNLGRGATEQWLTWVGQRCMELGPRYGGADVLAWWLVERTKPTPVPRRKADRQRLKALRRRLRGWWTHMQISQYLSLRTAELDPQRYGVVRRAA